MIRDFKTKVVSRGISLPPFRFPILSQASKRLRFLAIATLASLIFMMPTLLDIPSVQGQIINLPQVAPTQSTVDISTAGNLDIGKVRLDGEVLFRVAMPAETTDSSSNSTSAIERRVKTIEFHLSDIVNAGFDPATLQVGPSILNNQTILVASDKDWGPRNILTVTAFDVELDEPGTTDEIAKRWSKLIEKALLQAREQRQPAYQKRQLPIVIGILGAMVIASFGINRLQKLRLSRRQSYEQLRRELETIEFKSGDSFPSPTPGGESSLQVSPDLHRSRLSRFLPQLTLDEMIAINLILRRVLIAAQIGIWFGGIAMICERFPQTRAFGGWLLRFPLALIGIPIGIAVLNSIVDALLQWYVRRIVDRIQEKGGGDTRLRPRAKSIVSVLHQFSGYLVVLLGCILFFYLIGFFYIGLIILAATAFLAQDVLKDLAKTYFILVEDQYALEDWIQVGDINGKVEKMSLRNSQVRSVWGDLFTISHSNITEVTNFTHRYSGINLLIDVAYSTDLDQAMTVMEQVAQEMQKDSRWGQYITASNMKGVEAFGDNSITLRLIIMTEVGQQWDVGREYRRRLKPAFDQVGIRIPFPQRSIWFENAMQDNN